MPQVIRPFSVTLGNSGRRDLTVCRGEVRYTFDDVDWTEIAVRFPPLAIWAPVGGMVAYMLGDISLADLRAMAEADRESAEFAAPVTIVTDPEGVA